MQIDLTLSHKFTCFFVSKWNRGESPVLRDSRDPSQSGDKICKWITFSSVTWQTKQPTWRLSYVTVEVGDVLRALLCFHSNSDSDYLTQTYYIIVSDQATAHSLLSFTKLCIYLKRSFLPSSNLDWINKHSLIMRIFFFFRWTSFLCEWMLKLERFFFPSEDLNFAFTVENVANKWTKLLSFNDRVDGSVFRFWFLFWRFLKFFSEWS